MCNINLLISKLTQGKTHFMNCVSSYSYGGNSDGDGLGSERMFVAGVKKQDYTIFRDEIEKSKFLVSHQRLKTSGTYKDYQPFQSNRFVFAHNGVLSEFAKDGKSDTHVLFDKFRKVFSKEVGDDKTRIVNSIKMLLDEVSGTFSVAILDKWREKLYYFKNSTTRLTAWRSRNSIYMTTVDSNEVFLDLLGEKFKEIEIEDYTIYEIRVGSRIVMRKVGGIQEKKWEVKKHWKNKQTKSDIKELFGDLGREDCKENRVIVDDERERIRKGYCAFCWSRRGRWVDEDVMDFVCDDCIDKFVIDYGWGGKYV